MSSNNKTDLKQILLKYPEETQKDITLVLGFLCKSNPKSLYEAVKQAAQDRCFYYYYAFEGECFNIPTNLLEIFFNFECWPLCTEIAEKLNKDIDKTITAMEIENIITNFCIPREVFGGDYLTSGEPYSLFWDKEVLYSR